MAEAGQAIGKRLIFGNDEKTAQTLTVVGISGDFPTAQMSTPREQLLLPLAQQPSQELFLIARSIAGRTATEDDGDDWKTRRAISIRRTAASGRLKTEHLLIPRWSRECGCGSAAWTTS